MLRRICRMRVLGLLEVENLYVHFPFCRGKCRYCALYSRAGASKADTDAYAASLARLVEASRGSGAPLLKTVYFGGGTPALCNLAPILDVLSPHLAPDCEFTVELHPLDVCESLLRTLAAGGVNRISMGVESLSDETLANMGRGYSADAARRAFGEVRKFFDNAGIDLIVGYPGDLERTGVDKIRALSDWGLAHCSVYSLQNERGLAGVPSDDAVLDRIGEVAAELEAMGFSRYEISNYARPGRECRHNFAVWRGEDYVGLGEGACGRIGLSRTRSCGTRHESVESVTPDFDRRERRIFRLRTREGLDPSGFPEWTEVLGGHLKSGLLTLTDGIYRLTPRGMEVCDTILADLVS